MGSSITELPNLFFLYQMRILFYIFVVLLLGGGCSRKSSNAQYDNQKEQTREATTTIEWLTEKDHDFGTYSDKVQKDFDFVYVNTGKIPFVIHEARTFCGCTVAEYSPEPVMPGDTGLIHVYYTGNGFTPGTFHKHIDIHSNAKDSVIELSIYGFFEEEEQ